MKKAKQKIRGKGEKKKKIWKLERRIKEFKEPDYSYCHIHTFTVQYTIFT
jgi:hypothetical protein